MAIIVRHKETGRKFIWVAPASFSFFWFVLLRDWIIMSVIVYIFWAVAAKMQAEILIFIVVLCALVAAACLLWQAVTAKECAWVIGKDKRIRKIAVADLEVILIDTQEKSVEELLQDSGLDEANPHQ